MRVVEENSRNSLLTLLIKTPLLIGSISSQFSGENSFKEVGKTGSKSNRNLREKQCPNPQIYRLRKTSRWGLSDLSVDRPVDRPTVIFQTVVPSVDRSVDRGQIQRASLSVRSTAGSTGAFPESRALWTVDRIGRPTLLPEQACTSVHVGRLPGRPTSEIGRPVGRPLKPETEI